MAKSKAKKVREKMVREGQTNPVDNREFFPDYVGKPFISPFRYPKTLKSNVNRFETKHKVRFELSLLV
jgi:hypothetical protein